MDSQPLYRRWADHYLGAIRAGSLTAGDRMPSVRSLMRLHPIHRTSTARCFAWGRSSINQ